MNSLADFARAERQFLRSELEWFEAGAKLSVSGHDITSLKRNELKPRLEYANKALVGWTDA